MTTSDAQRVTTGTDPAPNTISTDLGTGSIGLGGALMQAIAQISPTAR